MSNSVPVRRPVDFFAACPPSRSGSCAQRRLERCVRLSNSATPAGAYVETYKLQAKASRALCVKNPIIAFQSFSEPKLKGNLYLSGYIVLVEKSSKCGACQVHVG